MICEVVYWEQAMPWPGSPVLLPHGHIRTDRVDMTDVTEPVFIRNPQNAAIGQLFGNVRWSVRPHTQDPPASITETTPPWSGMGFTFFYSHGWEGIWLCPESYP
jgi:hypothetical protein